MEGRFLQAADAATLHTAAVQAEAEGADAVFLGPSALGDPFVLAAGLSASVSRVLLGVCVHLSADERHPALLAREATSLDHVCGSRTVLCFRPPFTDGLGEAIALCRALWREGIAEHGGAEYVVQGAVNRPRPPEEGSPRIALDLTGSKGHGGEAAAPPSGLTDAADFHLLPAAQPGRCVMERVRR